MVSPTMLCLLPLPAYLPVCLSVRLLLCVSVSLCGLLVVCMSVCLSAGDVYHPGHHHSVI